MEHAVHVRIARGVELSDVDGSQVPHAAEPSRCRFRPYPIVDDDYLLYRAGVIRPRSIARILLDATVVVRAEEGAYRFAVELPIRFEGDFFGVALVKREAAVILGIHRERDFVGRDQRLAGVVGFRSLRRNLAWRERSSRRARIPLSVGVLNALAIWCREVRCVFRILRCGSITPIKTLPESNLLESRATIHHVRKPQRRTVVNAGQFLPDDSAGIEITEIELLYIFAVPEHNPHAFNVSRIKRGDIEGRKITVAKHGSHIRDTRGIEIRKIERGTTFLSIAVKHPAHVRNIRRVELGKVERGLHDPKHSAHVRDARGVEMRDIEYLEAPTSTEHSAHVRDARRVEMRDIERFKLPAIAEHKTHVGDARGVERRQSDYVLQNIAIVEHAAHVCDVVRIERRNIKRNISISSQICTITKHPAHVRDARRVEPGKIEGPHLNNHAEHKTHVGDARGIELGDVEEFEVDATVEHVVHIRDVRRVELGDVEGREAVATFEHFAHVGDVRRVELGDVEKPWLNAVCEHAAHVRHVRRVELGDVEGC